MFIAIICIIYSILLISHLNHYDSEQHLGSRRSYFRR